MSADPNSTRREDAARPLQEKILDEHQRLGPDDTFTFGCHPGVACYNQCCGDVNIFLSPYDVLRLRKRLGMTSTEFLDRYTLLPVQADMRTPVVLLRMTDTEEKSCPFLTEAGCSVYEDRPWPCRMYPLGMAAQKDTPDGWRGERFYFLLAEDGCLGHDQATRWTVGAWLEDQGVDSYEPWLEAYKELTVHEYFEQGGALSPEKMEMFFTATYDLDRFRTFVFETSFLEKFLVDEDFIEEIRYSDEALLRLGVLWLRFSLFGEDTIRMREEVRQAYKEALEKRTLHDRKRVQPSVGATP